MGSYLPMGVDDEEGPIIYDALCFFIEKQHPHLWGAKLERLPHIVSVLVDAYGSDLVNDELNRRIIDILKKLKEAKPAEMKSVWESFPAVGKAKLEGILSK